MKGFSLIEVIIVIGIMGIISLGIVTITRSLGQQNLIVQEKLTALDLERLLISGISRGINLCEKSIVDNDGPHLEFASADTATAEIPLVELSLDLAGEKSITKLNFPIGNSTLKVSSILIKNLTPISPDRYVGNLELHFDSRFMPLRPLTTVIEVNTTEVAADVHKLVGCFARTETGGGNVNLDPQTQAECEALGGTWVDPADASRPEFCSRPDDVLEWF